MRRRNHPLSATPATPLSGAPHAKCGPRAAPARLLLSLIFAPLLGGCYTYSETSLASLSPGLQARVQLTEDGFGRVVNQAAMNGVPVDMLDMVGRGVAGRVMTLGPSNLTVQLRGAGGAVYAADVPTQAVEQVSVRTFSRGRTIGAVAVGAVLFAGLYAGTTGGTTSAPGPVEPEQMVVPVAPFFTRILSIRTATLLLGFSARLGSGR